MPTAMIEDVRNLDPVSYIRTLGLQPEDSYGFIPTKLDEGAEFLYLYRDRPEYERARSTASFAPRVEMQLPASDPGGRLGQIVEQAQELQRMYGGGQEWSMGAPGDPMPAMPDVEKLVEAAKLRSSGAIDDAEYARLRAEAGVPGPGASPPTPSPPSTTEGGPEIVAHRLYPQLRSRNSTQQLDRFLPTYREAVGLCPEDVYGVFPWQTRTSSGARAGSTEWDDYWIVYRDRPAYAAARDAYAREMDEKGRWPKPVTAPGVGEAAGTRAAGGGVEVENDLWPRALLVIKQTGGQLADSIREKIAARGYEPEDSFGFCPNYDNGAIYFGWRRP